MIITDTACQVILDDIITGCLGEKYSVAPTAAILYNDESKEVAQIEIGWYATAKIEGETIVEIEAYPGYTLVTGIVTEIQRNGDITEVALTSPDGKAAFYSVNSALIWEEDSDRELYVGDTAKLKIEENCVTAVEIIPQIQIRVATINELAIVSGGSGIYDSQSYTELLIAFFDNTMEIISVLNDTPVTQNGNNVGTEALEKGQTISVGFQRETPAFVEITDQTSYTELSGTVQEVAPIWQKPTMSIALNNNESALTLDVSRASLMDLHGALRPLNSFVPGTIVRVFGTYEGADFKAAIVLAESNECRYSVRYYQENADGVGYTAVTQDFLPGTTGQMVTAPSKSFPGFTENTAKGVHSGAVTSNGGLVLSRYYDRNTYEINLNMNGAAALPPISAKYGAAVETPAQPARYGYAFGGWFADAALTQSYTFSTMPLNGATVYAKWTLKGEGRGIEYSIDDLLFRDSTTLGLLNRILSGDFLAEVSVTNLCSHEMDTVLLVTYDANGKMLDMYYLYANPAEGQSITLGTRIKNSGNIARIKAFVLPSLSNVTPLAQAKEK